MGLEALYLIHDDDDDAGRAVADLAYEAIKDTHTEHPAALGFNRV